MSKDVGLIDLFFVSSRSSPVPLACLSLPLLLSLSRLTHSLSHSIHQTDSSRSTSFSSASPRLPEGSCSGEFFYEEGDAAVFFSSLSSSASTSFAQAPPLLFLIRHDCSGPSLSLFAYMPAHPHPTSRVFFFLHLPSLFLPSSSNNDNNKKPNQATTSASRAESPRCRPSSRRSSRPSRPSSGRPRPRTPARPTASSTAPFCSSSRALCSYPGWSPRW